MWAHFVAGCFQLNFGVQRPVSVHVLADNCFCGRLSRIAGVSSCLCGGTFDQYLQHFKLIPAILWLRPLASVGH